MSPKLEVLPHKILLSPRKIPPPWEKLALFLPHSHLGAVKWLGQGTRISPVAGYPLVLHMGTDVKPKWQYGCLLM